MTSPAEPADPVDLPHTWRPLGVRLASLIFGGALFVICGFAWFGFSAEIRGRFTPAEKLTMLLILLAILACLIALSRSRVTAAAASVTVVNGFRTRRLDPAQIVGVTLPAGAPWATLDLADGSTVSAMGIQGSDGDRALVAVRELRAVLDRRP